LAVPYPKPDHHLQPMTVYVVYFAKVIPVGFETYEKAYYARQWGTGKTKPQPDHETTWGVSKLGIAATATARVWLDADPNDLLNNGGFPGIDMPWWREAGIQCFYPQFNARLVTTNAIGGRIVRQALGVI
jgi:hypothetical protein